MEIKLAHIIKYNLKLSAIIYVIYLHNITYCFGYNTLTYKNDIDSVTYLVSGSLIEEGVKRKKSDFFGFTIVAYEVVEDSTGNLFYKVTSEAQKVSTGKKGDFTFKLSSDKRYLIKCVKPGYSSDEVPLPKRNIAKGQHISLEITVRKAATAIVSGYVLSETDNNILRNAEVTLKSLEKGTYRTSLTENSGTFSFEILDGETYHLFARKDKFAESTPIKLSFEMSENGMLRRNILLKTLGIGKVYRLSGFFFGVNEFTINGQQAEALKEAVEIIRNYPKYQFEVACFSDARGDDEYNLNLTIARARSIVDYLIRKYNIMPDRLVPKGYGETHLLNECANNVFCSTEKHEENRRIELRILKVAE